MKEIIVEVIKYQAIDGNVYDKYEDCHHHEMILSGKRRVCITCFGGGEIPDEGNYHKVKCHDCNGKGWQEKDETPNWR